MSDALLEEHFLTWLYGFVGDPNDKNPHRTHWHLLRFLQRKEFTWLVMNDDDRAEDGLEIRRTFLTQHPEYRAETAWDGVGCSFLEMLVGLTDRLEFEEGSSVAVWFWHLLRNLDISGYTDAVWTAEAEREVDDILDRVIWRTYRPDGLGGLFPLRSPRQNQRHVELWYQMNAYLIEHSS